MLLDLYAFCWNEVELIPYFLRHYGPICRRIVVFDDCSDDGSRELLRAHPKVEVRDLDAGDSYVYRHSEISSKVWLESAGFADWVGVVAVDEFVGPDLLLTLGRQKALGATVVIPEGYEIGSESFPPTRILANPYDSYSKPCLWRPDMMTAVTMGPGNHYATFVGHVRIERPDGLYLHHMRFLGKERTWSRFQDIAKRRAERYPAEGKSWRYDSARQTFDARWDEFMAEGVIPARVCADHVWGL